MTPPDLLPKALSFHLCLLLVVGFVPRLSAQTSWGTAPASGQLTNAANWVGGVAPADGTGWLFTNSSIVTLTNGFTGYTVDGITFTTNASAYSFTGNAFTLTGGITNNSTSHQIISNNLTVNSAVNLSNTGNLGAELLSLRGALSGSGTITYGSVASSGRLTFSGGSHAGFTGAFIANSGRVNIGAAQSSASADYTFNNAAGTYLTANNNTSTYNFGSLSGTNTIQNNTANTTNTLSIGAKNNSTTFSGNISTNQSGTINVVKVGTGTQILSGNNNYIGATTISNGVLQIGAGGTAGSFSNTDSITIAGGSLAFNRSDNITQGVDFLSNGSVLSGAGGLIKMGAGTLILAAANTYSGTTRIDAGKLLLSNSHAIQNSTFDTDSAGLLSLATGLTSLTMGGVIGSGAFAPENYNTITNLTLNTSTGFNGDYSGAITNGATRMALVIIGSGTQTLSGNNTYTGPTTINGGGLMLGATGQLSSSTSVDVAATATNATFDISAISGGSLTLASIASATNGAIALGANNLTVGANNTSTIVAGTVSGTGGSLTKTGNGTLTLTGNNTYSGKTTINGGAILINNDARLGTAPGAFTADQLTLDGGRLAVTNNFGLNTNRGTTLGSGGGTFEVGADATLTISTGGLIAGTGTLTKTGAGTLILAAASTFSGGFVLDEGWARVSADSVLSGGDIVSGALGVGNITINGGGLLGSGRTLNATNITINGDFAVNSGTSAFNGRISLGADLIDLGGATRTVSLGRYTNAAASLSSGIESLRFITNAGFYFPVITNGTFRFVRDAAGSASDYASVSFGVTNIQFQGDSGFIVGTNVIAVLGPSFLFANPSGALPHVGTEDGGIFNLGITNSAGSQIIRSLSGTAGHVTSLGTLGSPTTTTLTISNQAGDNYDYGGQIVDGSSLNATLGTTATNVTFALTKTGAGTQILSGNNTYSGNTTVSAGALIINGDQSGATGILTVASGAILGGDGTLGSLSNSISGSIRPGNSIGTLTVNGDTTWNAGHAWVFELGSAAPDLAGASTGGSTQDLLAIAGAGSDFLKGTGSGWTFDFAGTGTNGFYQLVTWGGITTFTNTDFVASNLGGGYTGEFTILDNALYLEVIPEPSTYALLGLAALGLGAHVLRRRRL